MRYFKPARFAAMLIAMVTAAHASGTLRVGMQDDPDALDPARGGTFAGRIVFASLCDKLIDLSPGDLYFVACYQWDASVPPAAFRAHSGGIFIDMGVHEFDQLRWLTGQEFAGIHVSIPAVASEPPVAGDSESAQVLCSMSGGSSGLVSLGRRFPHGDVCWTQVFGTKGSEECRFLWPPDADTAFHHALLLQAESFALSVNGAAGEAAGAEDAVAALTAAERASGVFGRGGLSPRAG